MTARRPILLLALALALLGTPALAAIGEAPSALLDALASYGPAPAAGGGFTAASDFSFGLDESQGVVTGVHGEGALDDANIAFAAALIGAASGYGDGIARPAAEFFRTRAGDLAGQGSTALGVEEYELTLTVSGDSPYHLSFTLAHQQVDPGFFPPAAHSLGPADAEHVIREFSDFECPFCARFAEDVFPQLQSQVLEGASVRFEFHHFPLKSIHPNAVAGAEAAECVTAANDEASFWTIHDALFAHQSAWTELPDPTDALVAIAADAGLSTTGVAACIRKGTYSDAIDQAYQSAVGELRLTGTPTLFVDGLKVGDYTDLGSYTRLMALWDALQASAPAPAGAGSAGSDGAGSAGGSDAGAGSGAGE